MADVSTLNASFLVFNATVQSQDLSSVQLGKTENAGFKDAIQSAANKLDNNKADDQVKSDSIKDDTLTEKSDIKSVIKESKPEEKIIEEACESVKDCIKEIKQLIENFTDLSEEDLEEIMGQLGLVSTDLLNFENVIQVVISGENVPDISNLIMNEDFTNLVKEISNLFEKITSDISKELGISFEDAAKMLEGFETVDNEIKFDPKLIVKDENNEVKGEAILQNAAIAEDEEIADVRPQTNASNQNESENLEDKETIKAEVKKDTTEKTSNEKTNENFQTTFNNFTEKVSEVIEESAGIANAREVVEQIVDEIKATIKLDTSSIEMQLNPEHLGKVSINIATENDVVKAKIVVTDRQVEQIVKANLEILRENLNNQGLKVEDLEVTIASRSFNDQFAGTKEEQNGGKKSKKAFKSFDDDEFGIASEQINEEEELMLKGATVSYSA